MKKNIKLVSLLFALVLMFTACKSLNLSIFGDDFDAGAFVEGDFRSTYLNEHTDEYIALMHEGMSKEELEDIHHELVGVEIEHFFTYCEIEIDALPDEMLERAYLLFHNIITQTKFEIIETEKKGADYFVTLELSPIDIIQKAITEEFMNNLIEEYNALEVETIEEAEIFYADAILTQMESHLETLGYYPAQTLVIEMRFKEKYYEMVADDAQEFNALYLAYEEYKE